MKKRHESIQSLAGFQVNSKKRGLGKPVLTLSTAFGMNSVTTSLRIPVLKQKLYSTIYRGAFLGGSPTDNCGPFSVGLNAGVPWKDLRRRFSFPNCTIPANWHNRITPIWENLELPSPRNHLIIWCII